jgi:hypothetical protein
MRRAGRQFTARLPFLSLHPLSQGCGTMQALVPVPEPWGLSLILHPSASFVQERPGGSLFIVRQRGQLFVVVCAFFIVSMKLL